MSLLFKSSIPGEGSEEIVGRIRFSTQIISCRFAGNPGLDLQNSLQKSRDFLLRIVYVLRKEVLKKILINKRCYRVKYIKVQRLIAVLSPGIISMIKSTE